MKRNFGYKNIFISVNLVKGVSEFTCGAAQVEREVSSCDIDCSVGHRSVQ